MVVCALEGSWLYICLLDVTGSQRGPATPLTDPVPPHRPSGAVDAHLCSECENGNDVCHSLRAIRHLHMPSLAAAEFTDLRHLDQPCPDSSIQQSSAHRTSLLKDTWA